VGAVRQGEEVPAAAKGTESKKYAWSGMSGVTHPQPVGKLLPNNWGLYDMLGNVEELVSDYFALESITPNFQVPAVAPAGRVLDPQGPPPGDQRVTCGGSYAKVLEFRFDRLPADQALKTVVYDNQGFRVALEP
jgi:formylglycine-generating enzyme required for sulfatase activity